MDSSTEPSVDQLLAGRRVEEYDSFSLVTVPGSSNLTQKGLAELMEKLKESDNTCSTPVSSAELFSRLRDLTPPPDNEVEDEESRMLERDARSALQAAGCPPCYPPDLQVPLRDVPEEYEAIVSYWKSFPGTGDVVLRAQKSDWKRFCAFQAAVRRKYQKRRSGFRHYVEEVRQQRRDYDMGGQVRLDWHAADQSQMQNWIEFQHYHLRIRTGLLKQSDKIKIKLDDAQRKAKYDTTPKSKNNVRAYRGELDYLQGNLQDHDILLQWIEQQRLTMTTYGSTIGDDAVNHPNATPKLAAGGSPDIETPSGNKSGRDKIASHSKKSQQLWKYSNTRQVFAATQPDDSDSTQLPSVALSSNQPAAQHRDQCAPRRRSRRISRKPQRWGYAG